MKRFGVVISMLLFTGLSANAQFGLRASYNLNNAPAWDQVFSEALNRDVNIFSSSQSLTLDYWIRLPNHRVEFYPNISYHGAQMTIRPGVGQLDLPMKLQQIGGGLLAHIYPLDFTGDCDCPTFSKQGGLFKKGFFILGGLGADYSLKDWDRSGLSDGNIDIKGSIGLGMDIGITDLFTISPFIQFQRYFDVSGHDLSNLFNLDDSNISSSINQLQLGIRVGFRPDYTKNRF